MGTNRLFTAANLLAYLRLSLWIFVLLAAVYILVTRTLPYLSFSAAGPDRYQAVRWSLIGHVLGGLLALIIGPFQFWTKFRHQNRQAYRRLVRLYLLAILISSISAIHLAWSTSLSIHWTWSLALQGLALAWIVTSGMAYVCMLRKQIAEYREWIIRSYVVTFSFLVFRIINGLPFVVELGPFAETGPASIWVSWTIPLLMTEVWLSWTRPHEWSDKYEMREPQTRETPKSL